MEMLVWNIILSGIVAVLGFMVKGKFDELDRLGILLNKTREEVARDHVTRSEVNQTLDKLAERIDKSIQRLEAKLDGMKKG
jgi:archaellum component FlaC